MEDEKEDTRTSLERASRGNPDGIRPPEIDPHGDAAARSKQEARARFLARRAGPTSAERATIDAALCACLLGLVAATGARAVHAYWPAPERGEPDLAPALAALHTDGVVLVLPRVAARRPPTLTHHVWDGHALAPGAFGLREPAADAPPADLTTLDLVVVPTLAADRHGVRLGYGGGFYDAFLGALVAEPRPSRPAPARAERAPDAVTGARPHLLPRPLLACVLPAAAIADALPCEPHDVPVDVLVTETGLIWTNPARRHEALRSDAAS